MTTKPSKALSEAKALHAEAMRLYREGEYARATPLAKKALSIFKKAVGPRQLEIAPLLNNLASLYTKHGLYKNAKQLYRRALNVHKNLLNATDANMATVLNNLAVLHMEHGEYREAEPLYENALRIREISLNRGHEDIAVSLNNLAGLYKALGSYAKAEQLYKRALCIREERLGPEHRDVAQSLNNLATLYQAQGVYENAEPLFKRAQQIFETALGSEHPDVATSLTNLASVYQTLGAYTEAKSLYKRALCIRERALGPEHRDVAQSLNNLALLFVEHGSLTEAEPLLKRALRLRETALGPEHPSVATSLTNLSLMYQKQGANENAKLLLERAWLIQNKVLSPDHPDAAATMANLAALYQAQGAYGEASSLYQRALLIEEKSLGQQHMRMATSLNNLGLASWQNGDRSHAHNYLARAAALREHYFVRALPSLPEKRKRLLLQCFHGEAETYISLLAHSAPDDARILALALTTLLQRKGRVLEEIVHDQRALQRNLSPTLRVELAALQELQAELVARRHAPYNLHHSDTLGALEKEAERREAELSRKSTDFRAQAEPVTVERLQAALPQGAALVEFARYHRFDLEGRGHWKEEHYVAYVLRRDGPPQWIGLGEATTIDAVIVAARKALTGKENTCASLRDLDEFVFAPLRRLLGPVDRWLLSPDGTLHLVPFAALVDEEGRHLVERARITYLTSGRDLVRPTTHDTPATRPVIVAAPAYPPNHKPLPGTENEARTLQEHFPQADVFLGPDATKGVLSGAKAPLFLHIATHGFVGTSSTLTPARAARSLREGRDLTVVESLPLPSDDGTDLEDTLDAVGLVLAGADETEATLTARDVAGLDLSGTQLVVLSACETGAGRIASGEGVYGLRRALAIAGAEAQVVSLWKVDDAATATLMGRYYGNLRRGEGRSEALRQAQLAMLRDSEHAHPFYWAAFVPIGEEGPLRLGPIEEQQ